MGDVLGLNEWRGSTYFSLSKEEKNLKNVVNAAEHSNDNEGSKDGG